MVSISVTLLCLFCLFHLCLSSESGKHQDSVPCPDPVSMLRPEILFSRSGCDDQDKVIALERMVLEDKNRVARVTELLSCLNDMQDPYVSEPVADLVAGVLEKECGRHVSGMCIGELKQVLSQEHVLTNFRFMYDMRLLRSAPVMRRCLLRAFYRVIAQAKDKDMNWLAVAISRHLQTAAAEAVAQENANLKAILLCLMREAAHSTRLLSAFFSELSTVDSAAISKSAHDLALFASREPDILTYLVLVEVYMDMERPLASEIAILQSSIDWKQVFQTYGVLPGMLTFTEIPDCIRPSLPIDSEDQFLRRIFEKYSVHDVVRWVKLYVFDRIWRSKEGALIDIRPEVKRYINYLWGRGMTYDAQAVAIAMCSMYDMDTWEGKAGWEARIWSGAESGKMARSEQMTVFHVLPREILKVIGPVMPVLVSKATYQLVELRASYSNLPYFVSKMLRSFEKDVVPKLLHLHNGWTAGLSKEGIRRAKELIDSSSVRWINRLWEVTEMEEEGGMRLSKQGFCGFFKLSYCTDPHKTTFSLIFSLAFGAAPFEFLDPSERANLLLVLKTQYPWFISFAQALESLTGSAKDKPSRVHALVDTLAGSSWPINLFCEWLFTRYLSEVELFELVRTCNAKSQLWATFMRILGSCSTVPADPAAPTAIRRLAGIIKRGLLRDGIDVTRTRAMALALGVPKELLEGVLKGDQACLSTVLPSLGKDRGSLGCTTLPASDSWTDSLQYTELRQYWFVFLNLSDDEIIGLFKGKADFFDSATMDVLSCCLAVAAKSRFIVETAMKPSFHDGKAIAAISDPRSCRHNEWEAATTIFDRRLSDCERHGRNVEGSLLGISPRIVGFYYALLCLRRECLFYGIFVNLHPELTSLAQCALRDHCANMDIVLPMLLEGRTVGSIGKNLYLLAEANVHRMQEILSWSPLVKQEYLDMITAAAADFAGSFGRAGYVGGAAQLRRCIENFDFKAVEEDVSLCFKVFGGIIKSLAVPESDDSTKTLEVCIRYLDGEVKRPLTVSLKHPPVCLFKVIFKVIKEPFELEVDVKHLHAASAISELSLPDTITVRVLSDPEEIVKQLNVIFQLVTQSSQWPETSPESKTSAVVRN